MNTNIRLRTVAIPGITALSFMKVIVLSVFGGVVCAAVVLNLIVVHNFLRLAMPNLGVLSVLIAGLLVDLPLMVVAMGYGLTNKRRYAVGTGTNAPERKESPSQR